MKVKITFTQEERNNAFKITSAIMALIPGANMRDATGDEKFNHLYVTWPMMPPAPAQIETPEDCINLANMVEFR